MKRIKDRSGEPALEPMDTPLAPLRAASVLMVALERSFTHNLREFCSLVAKDKTVVRKVGLTDETWQLIKDNAGYLDLVSDSLDTKPRIKVVLCMCPKCRRPLYVLSAQSAPTKCSLTFGCEAKVVKAKRASSSKTVQINKRTATQVAVEEPGEENDE